MANEVLRSIQVRALNTGTHLEVHVEGVQVLKLQSGELPYLYLHPQLNAVLCG